PELRGRLLPELRHAEQRERERGADGAAPVLARRDPAERQRAGLRLGRAGDDPGKADRGERPRLGERDLAQAPRGPVSRPARDRHGGLERDRDQLPVSVDAGRASEALLRGLLLEEEVEQELLEREVVVARALDLLVLEVREHVEDAAAADPLLRR